MKTVFTTFFILLIILSSCSTSETAEKTNKEGEKVVIKYFESWDHQDYGSMYSLISDGFKALEPTASTLDAFTTYAQSQGISNVNIISVKQVLGNENEATVDYNIEFIIGEKIIPFSGTFTVKYKPNDTQPGWKLIHPYGEHIDTS